MRQAKFYIGISILSIIALSVVRVVITNNISTNGIDLGNLQEKIAEYKKHNALLHEEILKASSFTNIASEAAEIGFVESKKQIVVTSPIPLALKQ